MTASATMLRGKARMMQLAAEAEAERRAITTALLADLGRPPTERDKIAAEQVAAATVQARRLRRNGRDDAEQTRLIAQLLRTTGMRPDKPVPVKPVVEDFAEQMRRLATPPQAAAGASAVDRADTAADHGAQAEGGAP